MWSDGKSLGLGEFKTFFEQDCRGNVNITYLQIYQDETVYSIYVLSPHKEWPVHHKFLQQLTADIE